MSWGRVLPGSYGIAAACLARFARSLGEGDTSARCHLDVLTGALVMRHLPPWFENLGKRQIKAPKV